MNEKSRILFKVAEIRFEKWKGGRGLKFFPPPQRSAKMTPLYVSFKIKNYRGIQLALIRGAVSENP